MVEIIETLNNTSTPRTILYCIILLIMTYFICESLVYIAKYIFKK